MGAIEEITVSVNDTYIGQGGCLASGLTLALPSESLHVSVIVKPRCGESCQADHKKNERSRHSKAAMVCSATRDVDTHSIITIFGIIFAMIVVMIIRQPNYGQESLLLGNRPVFFV